MGRQWLVPWRGTTARRHRLSAAPDRGIVEGHRRRSWGHPPNTRAPYGRSFRRPSPPRSGRAREAQTSCSIVVGGTRRPAKIDDARCNRRGAFCRSARLASKPRPAPTVATSPAARAEGAVAIHLICYASAFVGIGAALTRGRKLTVAGGKSAGPNPAILRPSTTTLRPRLAVRSAAPAGPARTAIVGRSSSALLFDLVAHACRQPWRAARNWRRRPPLIYLPLLSSV